MGDAGITVPTRDASALASAIRVMLDDESLRQKLAERGRQRILEKFSWDVAAKEMEKLYRRIIVEKAS